MNLIYMYNFIYRKASNHTVDSSLFKLTLIRVHRNLLWQLGLCFSTLLIATCTLHSESDKTGKVIKCTSSYALFNLLPFRPIMKLTLAPRGTSSMVWHMKFTIVIFSMIPTSASDWNHNNAQWLISVHVHKPGIYTWSWPFTQESLHVNWSFLTAETLLTDTNKH